jgi:hypothetical protein
LNASAEEENEEEEDTTDEGVDTSEQTESVLTDFMA